MTRPLISLGDFDLDRPVGRGGMAEVWLGTHRTLGQQAAIKVVKGSMAHEARFVHGFHREVQAVAGLDHPGVVGVFDTGLVDADAADAAGGTLIAGSPWLAMEYADGGDLSTWETPLTWGRLHGLLLEVLDALAHAHARGVIHRDLKPGNILLRAAGGRRLMLTDFGIAHIVEPSLESGGVGTGSSGTPHYMAPEQIRGHWRDYGPWTDLYAVGCLAYEFACGRPPFDGRGPVAIAIKHVSAPVPALGATRGVPQAFEGWVQRLLAKDPRERFENAADAAWHLARLPAPRSIARIHPGPSAVDGRETQPTRSMTTLAVLVDTALLDAVAPDRSVTPRPAGQPPAGLPARGLPSGDAPTEDPASPEADAAIARAPNSRPPSLGLRDPLPDLRPGRAHDLPPMPASWRLPDGGESARNALGTGLFAVRRTPFVGRIIERDALWSALRTVRDSGRSRLVLVHGSAGSGKSRLTDWLACRAEEVGAGHALRASHGPVPSPLHGVISAIRSWFRGDGLLRRELRARIEERLHRLMPFAPAGGLAEAAEGLAALLDPDPSAPGRPRNPAEQRAATGYWLRQAASRRPLVLCLDDAHFDLDALALAESLLDDPHQAPILVVATVDPAVVGSRRRIARLNARLLARLDVDRIGLGPLPAEEHRVFVRTLLQLEPTLVQAVGEATGGDPWFAEQVVADWIEQGILTPGPAGYRAECWSVPTDRAGLVRQRLARFAEARPDPRATWGALSAAAALGTAVERAEWHRVCALAGIAPPEDLEAALYARGWITEIGGGWAFTHHAWRRALVDRAHELGLWPALNRHCARILRSETPSAVGWIRVARHHVEAGELREAAVAGVEAATACLETGDYYRVMALVTAATEHADAAGVEPDHMLRARALWLEADACRYLARFDEAHALLDRLRPFPQPETQAELRRIRAGVVHMEGDLEQARALYASAAARYAAIDQRLGEVRSRHGAAWVETTRGRFAEAQRIFEDAAETAHAHGFELDEAWCRHGTASALIFQGLPGAEGPARQALETFTRFGARAGVAATRMFIGEALGFEGRYGEARTWFDSAIEEWQTLDANFTGLGWTGLGLMCLEAGWDDEAARALRSAGSVPPAFAMLHTVGVCLLAARAGDLEPWRAVVERAPGSILRPPRLRRHLVELAERAAAAGLSAVAATSWRWAASTWRALDPAEADRCEARAAALLE